MHTQHQAGWCVGIGGCAASEQQPAATSLQVQQAGTWTAASTLALEELWRTGMHNVIHQDGCWYQA